MASLAFQGYAWETSAGMCSNKLSSLWGMLDRKQHPSQTGNFVVTPSKTSYVANEKITFTIKNTVTVNGRPKVFKGFLLYGESGHGSDMMKVGDFTWQTDANWEGGMPDECANSKTTTHTTPNLKASLTVTWTAPSEDMGDIVFKSIVYESRDFWIPADVTLTFNSAAPPTNLKTVTRAPFASNIVSRPPPLATILIPPPVTAAVTSMAIPPSLVMPPPLLAPPAVPVQTGTPLTSIKQTGPAVGMVGLSPASSSVSLPVTSSVSSPSRPIASVATTTTTTSTAPYTPPTGCVDDPTGIIRAAGATCAQMLGMFECPVNLRTLNPGAPDIILSLACPVSCKSCVAGPPAIVAPPTTPARPPAVLPARVPATTVPEPTRPPAPVTAGTTPERPPAPTRPQAPVSTTTGTLTRPVAKPVRPVAVRPQLNVVDTIAQMEDLSTLSSILNLPELLLSKNNWLAQVL